MPTERFTDAIALLKADHRKVEELFDKFEAARPAARQKIAEQICTELKIHTVLEEEIFYLALQGKIEEETWTEAFVEHDGAKVLINDIMASSPEDDFYAAKVKVLGEEIRHHVQEEERRQTGMFAQARATGIDLIDLRDRMLMRRQALLEQARADGLPAATLAVVRLAG